MGSRNRLVDQEGRWQYRYTLEVQADGSHDIFIRGKSTVDQIRVVDDVPAKQDSPPDCIQEVNRVRERDEYPNNPGHAYGDATVYEQKEQEGGEGAYRER